MIKYLWIFVIVTLYLLWTLIAIRGFIETVVAAKKYHDKLKFDYLPDVTVGYILVHAIAIFVWSIIEFLNYYL